MTYDACLFGTMFITLLFASGLFIAALIPPLSWLTLCNSLGLASTYVVMNNLQGSVQTGLGLFVAGNVLGAFVIGEAVKKPSSIAIFRAVFCMFGWLSFVVHVLAVGAIP